MNCKFCNQPVEAYKGGNCHLPCYREWFAKEKSELLVAIKESSATGVEISPAAQSPTSVGDDNSPRGPQ